MKKTNVVLSLIPFSVVIVTNCWAFEPRENLPVLRQIRLSSTIAKIAGSIDYYEYDYSLYNSNTNSGSVMSIVIDLTERAKRIQQFNSSVGFVDNRMAGFGKEHGYPPIVAVSDLKIPDRWFGFLGSVAVNWVVHGSQDDHPWLVVTGKSLQGLGFKSPAVPGITTFVVTPVLDLSKFYPDIHDVTGGLEEENALMRQINQDRDAIKFTGRTLGPVAPPVDLSELCDTFILDLIGQVREAEVLGWIKHDLRKDRDDDDDHGKRTVDEKGKKKGRDKDDDEDDDNGDDDDSDLDEKNRGLPGVAKSIIKKLTKVRQECLREKFGIAREKLRALIKQVSAQRGKHLTDEAYYLIRFNAEFLLEKI